MEKPKLTKLIEKLKEALDETGSVVPDIKVLDDVEKALELASEIKSTLEEISWEIQ